MGVDKSSPSHPTSFLSPLLHKTPTRHHLAAPRDDFGLKDVNMGVDMGSRVAIVGPNGAGKTTLMNLLSGDLVPTHGEQRRSFKLRVGRCVRVGYWVCGALMVLV